MTPAASPQLRGRRPGHWIIYVVPFILIGITALVASAALEQDPRGCSDDAHQVLPDYFLLTAGFGSLLVGRLLGYVRYDKSWLGWRQLKPTELAGSLGLLLLFVATSAALIYEAVGVDLAGGHTIASLEPITYYVRCAIYDDKTGGTHGLLTLAVLVFTCGLVGHWLWAWHPAEDRDADDVPSHA